MPNGQEQELKRLETEAEQHRKRLEELSKQLESAQKSIEQPRLFSRIWELFVPFAAQPWVSAIAAKQRYEQQKATVDSLKQQVEAAQSSLYRTLWQRDLYAGLPLMVRAGRVKSVADALEKFPAGGFELTDEDKSLVEKILKQAATPTVPAVTTIKTSEEAALEALATPPRAIPVGLSALTIQEIIKALTAPARPRLPPGMTAEEALQIFKYNDTDEMLDDYEKELIKTAEERRRQADLMRQGLAQIDLPQLSNWEWLKMVATQPMLFVADVAEKYSEYWSRPIAGLAIGYAGLIIPGKQRWQEEYEKMYAEARAAGKSWFAAHNQAFDKLTLIPGGTGIVTWNSAVKLAIEVLADPVTYIGIGFVSKAVRPFPFVGKYLAAANDAVIRIADYPFVKAMEWWKTRIPKTAIQEATQAADAALRDLNTAVIRQTGKMIHQVTPDELIKVAADARRAYLVGGAEALETPGGAFGKWQLLERHIELDDMSELFQRIGVNKSDVTLEQVASINKLYEAVKLPTGMESRTQRGLLTLDEATSEFLRIIGKTTDVTPEIRAAVSDFLSEQTASAIRRAEKIFEKGVSVPTMLRRFQDNVRDMILAQRNSPIYKRLYQHGLANSKLVTSVEGFMKHPWVVQLDQLAITPMARQYLIFAAYGPWNIAETFMRGTFRGTNMLRTLRMVPPFSWIPGLKMAKQTPTRILLAQWGDVPNLPAEIIRRVTSEASPRGEMWVTTGIGRTAFRDLKGLDKFTPPGVIRELPIETIAGRKVPAELRSMNNINLYWADIQEGMRDWYLKSEATDELKRIAPDLVERVYRAVPDITKRKLTGLTADDLADLQEYVTALAFRGPAAVRANIQDLTGWQLGKALKQVDELLMPITGVDEASKEWIRHQAEIGRAFSDPDGVIRELSESELDKMIIQKLQVARLFDEFAADMAQIIPRTDTDLSMMVKYIDDSFRANRTNLLETHRISGIRGHQLTEAERNILHEAVTSRIIKYVDDVEGNLKKMSQQVRHYVEETQPTIDKSAFIWGSTVPEEVKERILRLIENLPANIKLNVKEFRINRRLQRANGRYIHQKGVIEFANTAFTDSTFYHEIGHDILYDIINKQKYDMLEDFWTKDFASKTIKELGRQRQLFPERAHWSDADILYSVPEFRKAIEDFSKVFADYVIGKDIGNFTDVFVKHFPKQIPKLKIAPERLAALRAIPDIWDEQIKILRETLPKIRRVYSDAAAKRISWDEAFRTVEGLWNEYFDATRPLEQQLDELRLILGGQPIPKMPAVETELLPWHVAYIFQTTGDDLARGMFKGETHTLMTKEEFIDTVYQRATTVAKQLGKTAEQCGFTEEAIGKVYDRIVRTMGIRPEDVSLLTPKNLQLEAIRKGLHTIRETYALPKETVDTLNNWLEEIARNLEQTVDYDELLKTKTSAMEAARQRMSIDFTDYDAPNIVDGFMRLIFPFWHYESQRWSWVLRNAVFRPQVGINLGRYMNYTEGGYIPIPGTDIEVNPFRGTVWMGGFRRLYLRDFPEFFDSFPGMEMWDYLMRFGFYPNILITLPWIMFGTKAAKTPELGEALPAWAVTPLELYIAAFPKSEPAKWLAEQIFPSRYRDYITMLEINKMGHDGLEILAKRQEGIALTPEEQAIWDAARRRTALYQAMESQAAMTRFRPEELRQVYEKSAQIIEEITGLTPKQQRWIRNHSAITGKRLADYIGGLTPIQQEMLYEASGLQQWAGMTTPLLPSAEGEKAYRTQLFWKGIEKRREEAKAQFMELDRRFQAGEIPFSQWKRETAEVLRNLAIAVDELHKEPFYRHIRLTYEERVKAFEEQGRQPTFHPIQELLWRYYELKPEKAYDEESGTWEVDWDTYWRHTSAIINAMSPELREEFIANMQRDWTPLRKLWWEVNREWIRPYRNVRQVYLEKLPPEEQAIIKRYLRATSEEEQTALQELTRPDGTRIVASFEAAVRTARRNLRLLNPELDAWLRATDVTKELLTPEAEAIYQRIRAQMLGNP